MWGNLNKLGDLASKAVSNVQKVGLRAKEAINQIDADDFFEKELNDAPPVNPLLKPEVKPKNKELKLNKDVKENSAKQNLPNEENLSNSPVNSKPLIIKKQKAQEAPTNLSGQDLKDPSDSVVAKSLDLNSLLSQPTQSNMEKNAKSNPELNERQTETAATSTTASGKKAGNREVPSPSDSNELNELKMALKANEEALETYAIDNDKLIKERNELKELADTFQSKNSTLDKNLTEILAKNTSLEEQVNRLNRELVIAKKSTKVSDIHTEVPEGRKEAISDYIGECVQLYKTDISQKLVENLNQDLLNQIALEEEGISDDVRNLLESWVVKGDVLNKAAEGVIPEEKIIKPFYDENLLKEEIECHKDENNKLRVKAEDYEERLRQLEAQLKREQEDFAKYKDETELTLKRYTEDFVRVEQNLENLEEEAKEYKAVLKGRGEDIERLEKASEDKDAEIRNLEAKLKAEIEAKEDMSQQYEGIVTGMKDFEGTMMELNKENERLSAQHKEMSQQLAEEKKRAKDIEHTLSVEAKNKLLEKLSNLNSLNRDLEVEKVVESKLTVHDGRISAEGFGQALEEGLILALEMANKKFGSELDVEKEKEREKYNALLGNFERLQGELRDALKREKEAQSAKEELKRKNDEQTEIIDNLNSSVGNYTNKIKELQKTVNELQETKKRYLDEAAVKNGEIEQLKINLNTLQEEREENANYLARLEAETGEIPELQARLERQAIEIGNLNDVLQAKEEEAQQLNGTIVNLQAVIDDNQQIQENLSSQYTNEIKRLRADLEQSARKSQILQEYKEKFEVLEKDTLEREAKIKELTIKLRETEQEKNAVNAEAAALIKKAKNDAMYKENLVDKRVITNFLVKYFDANATFPVKLGILETLSSILAFNDDDRAKLGLPRQTPEPNNASSPTRIKSSEESKTNQPEKSAETKETSEAEKEEAEKEKAEEQAAKPQKSFKQMFMSFLLENE